MFLARKVTEVSDSLPEVLNQPNVANTTDVLLFPSCGERKGSKERDGEGGKKKERKKKKKKKKKDRKRGFERTPSKP